MNIFRWLFKSSPANTPQVQLAMAPQTSPAAIKHRLYRLRIQHKEWRHNNLNAVRTLLYLAKRINDLPILGNQNYMTYRDELKKTIDIHSYLKQNPPSEYQCILVFRLAGIKYAKGECNHRLTMDDIKAIINWEYDPFSEQDFVINWLNNYEVYWDDVLNNYKRPVARIKRLKYLEESTNKLLQNSDFTRFPKAITIIKAMQAKYSAMLDYSTHSDNN